MHRSLACRLGKTFTLSLLNNNFHAIGFDDRAYVVRVEADMWCDLASDSEQQAPSCRAITTQSISGEILFLVILPICLALCLRHWHGW
jgi:hypothetical protein